MRKSADAKQPIASMESESRASNSSLERSSIDGGPGAEGAGSGMSVAAKSSVDSDNLEGAAALEMLTTSVVEKATGERSRGDITPVHQSMSGLRA